MHNDINNSTWSRFMQPLPRFEIFTDTEVKEKYIDEHTRNINYHIRCNNEIKPRNVAYNDFLDEVALLRSSNLEKTKGISKLIDALIEKSELIIDEIIRQGNTNPDRIKELTGIISWANNSIKDHKNPDTSTFNSLEKEINKECLFDDAGGRALIVIVAALITVGVFFLFPLVFIPVLATGAADFLFFSVIGALATMLAGGVTSSLASVGPVSVGREVRELNSFFKASETQGDEKVAEHQGEDISTSAVSVDLAPAM
jgi:hypothetical protein